MNTMRRSTIVFLICAIAAKSVEIGVWTWRAPGLVLGTAIFLFILLFALILELCLRPSPKAESLSSFVLVGATLTASASIWLNHESYIRSHWPFEPFVGSKIMAVLWPLLCPPNRLATWSSLAIIAAFPLVSYYSWDPEVQMALGIQEPWITVIFIFISGLLYEFKLQLSGLRQLELEWSVKSKALQRFAHLLLGAQHLVNTPMQRMEVLIHMIDERFPESNPLIQRFDACFSSVKRIGKILMLADSSVPWDKIHLPKQPEQLEAEVKKLVAEFNNHRP